MDVQTSQKSCCVLFMCDCEYVGVAVAQDVEQITY